MSDRTKCNFCALADLRSEAARRGVTVILTPAGEGWTSVRYSDGKAIVALLRTPSEECEC